MPFRSLLALSIGFLLALALPANAQVATGNLSVTVEVTATCKIGTASLAFGTYGVGQTSDLRAEGSIAYEGCGRAQLRIGLDGGRAGTVNGRTMTNTSGDRLVYQLYQDAARTKVWGTGPAALVFTPTKARGTVVVYGTIPGGQAVPAGRYSDTVLVSIDF